MTTQPPRAIRPDPRLVGAVIALGLDLACLAVGVLLARAAQPVAGFILFGGATGLVVGPLVGWRYGPAAATRQPLATWIPRALTLTVLVGVGLWFAYDLAALILVGPPGGPANLVPFVSMVVLETTVFGLVVILLVTLPLGGLWLGLMWLVGRWLDAPRAKR